jgi:hypothetical protein
LRFFAARSPVRAWTRETECSLPRVGFVNSILLHIRGVEEELNEEHRVARKALPAALTRFCEENGDDVPPASTVGRWLTERGVRESRLDGRRAYRGIGLFEGND